MFTRLIQRKRPRKSALSVTAALVAVAGLSAAAVLGALSGDSGTVNVQIPDRTTSKVDIQTAKGAFVSYFGDSDTTFGASGTGLFNPFVRIQASPTEQGYNTNSSSVQFDEKTGTWTHAILVSQIPQRPCPTTATTPPVTLGSETCFELFNDINENNTTPFISLNKVEVYFASGTGAANLTNYPFTSPNPSTVTVTKQYDFAGNILIKDVNQGSGRGDLRYDIPLNGPNGTIDVSSINCDYGNPLCSTYFVLYSQWGTTGTLSGTNYNTDGGFEEWKVKIYPVVHILKTANPVGPVNAGNPIGFDITVSNTSAIDATNVVITDPLPAGPTGGDLSWSLSPAFTGCSITGSAGGQTLNCTFATLAANSSIGPIHITSATTKADCALVSNTARFTTGNDGTGSSTATVTVQCGALRILKETTKSGNALVKTTGATFSITGPGSYSATVVDNGTGSIDEETGTAGIGAVCISGLAPGTYSVTETAPPTGYGLPATTTGSATVATGTNCTTSKPTTANSAVFLDPPLGQIEVKFSDLGSGETKASIVCTKGTTPVVSPVSENGAADPALDDTDETFTNLPPATYNCQVVIDP